MVLKHAVLGLAVALAAAPTVAQQEGNWLVRARAVHLNWANKSDAGTGALTAALLPADTVKVNNKAIPEIDITYFFTKNLAAELILTYPQKQNVTISSGPLAEPVGTFKQLPPTLTLQYHFLPDGQIRPYVGLGVNYTHISGVNLRSNIGGATLQLESSSVGASLQAGVDFKLSNNLFPNVDVKKINIESDLMANGVKSSHLKLDPLAVGVGLGWRF